MIARILSVLRRFLPRAVEPSQVDAAPTIPIRDLVRRFWPVARPYRGWIGLSLLFVALGPPVQAATIWLTALLVDEVLVPQNLQALPRLALAYVGLTLLGGVIGFGRDYLSAWVAEHVLFDLRTRLFRHLHQLSPDNFARRRLGDVLSRLTDDVDQIETLIASGVADGLGDLFKLLFFAGALVAIDWRLALVALVVAPPFWLAARRFAGRIKALAREQRRFDGAIAAVAEESLANAPLVQAYNRQEAEADRFEREARGNLSAQLGLARLEALFSPLVDLVELAGVLVVVGFGAWSLIEGRITLGALLAFLAYLSQLYGPVRGLSRLVNDAFSASAGAERVVELLDDEPAVREAEHPVVLHRAVGKLRVDGVSYRYPEARHDALADVSFRLAPGESIALVGASGAGKSTLIKLLLRFDDPATGRLDLDGHDLRDLSLRSLRDNVAVLLQETLLLDGSVRDNIAYGRPGATDREIVAAAKAADADDFIRHLPEGYQTRVGQRGRALSGGQRQRLAIARAMIRAAPLLILDEPTTGLDAETGERILEPLRRLMRDRTTIVVSHNLLTVRDTTTIAVLDRGRIVEHGSHAALLDRDGAYARLLRLHDLGGADGSVATMEGDAGAHTEASDAMLGDERAADGRPVSAKGGAPARPRQTVRPVGRPA